MAPSRRRPTARGRRTTVRRRRPAARQSRNSYQGRRRRSSTPKRKRRSKLPEFEYPKTVPKNMQDVKFNSYIKKVSKRIQPYHILNGKSVRMIDALLKNALHSIANQAKTKMGRRKVLKPPIITRALRKMIPKSILERAHEHAQRALDKYESRTRRY
ncbi:uncharacterized protein LOC131932686 [Physella acuta]|uniref:uncharacterized protein LOC131932686 n=1 Tax=Physella acuta TaxID=109671 RepID=UPI0027DCFFE0|nr:uncharacterized protein LOC131932686 [Physella acuta]